MSSKATENPVLLWGDLGPDVYKLSQIYDPRNDRYVETPDTSVQSGKDYYQRLQLILTTDTEVHEGRDYYERIVDKETGAVTFPRVTPNLGDNPSEMGWYMDSGGKIYVFSKVETVGTENPKAELWYEVNEDAQNACGKYVPAVDSLVVVDELTCDYKVENRYKTRMILIVKSVDAAFNVTFATAEFGLNTEDTTRSIDYGNERFYLFFDRKTAGRRNVLLTPDRKLMLYGKNTYGYRLKRDGAIISTNLPTIQTRDDAFVPYSRATGKRVSITYANYLDHKESYIDILLPNGLQRVIQLPGDDPSTLMPTLDITFRKGVRYYTQVDGVTSVLDTTGLVNEPIDNEHDYDVGILDANGNPILFHEFYEQFIDEDGRVDYFKTSDHYFVSGKHYYVKVDDTYRSASTDYLAGRTIRDWEEKDPGHRKVLRPVAKDPFSGDWNGDVIGRIVYEHTSSQVAVNSVFLPERCFLKSNCSIVEDEAILMEIFSFDYETNQAQLIMSLNVIAKEAAALDTTDVTTRQITKFDVELNGSSTAGDIWYLQQGQDWREVFNMVPKITFDDGSAMTVPIDGKSCYVYGLENVHTQMIGREFQILFKFFPHKRLNIDWQKIGLTPTKNFMTVRKTVKIINDLSMRIRKISLIPAYNYVNDEYELYFMIFRTDFMAPPIIRQKLETKYLVQTYAPTQDKYASKYETGDLKGNLKTYYKKLNSGHFMPIEGIHEGDDLDELRPTILPYKEIYERQSQPSTSIQDVRFMNDNGDVEYIPAAAAGSNFGYVQRAQISELVTIADQTAKSIYQQSTLFKLADMLYAKTPFKWLIGEDETGRQWDILPYGKAPRPFLRYREEIVQLTLESGEVVESKAGAYRIDPSKFSNVKSVLDAFYYASMPPRGVAEEGTVDDEEMIPTHFYIRACSDDSACSGFVPLCNPVDGDGGANYHAAALMVGGGRSDDTIGGAIPVTVRDSIYGQLGDTPLMGTVIVEFVHQYDDPDDVSKKLYKHLWAVPVEVLDEKWERNPSA